MGTPREGWGGMEGNGGFEGGRRGWAHGDGAVHTQVGDLSAFLAAALALKGLRSPHVGPSRVVWGRNGLSCRSILTARGGSAAPQLVEAWHKSPGTAAGSACTAAKPSCSAAIGSQRQSCCSQTSLHRRAVIAAAGTGSSAGCRTPCSPGAAPRGAFGSEPSSPRGQRGLF